MAQSVLKELFGGVPGAFACVGTGSLYLSAETPCQSTNLTTGVECGQHLVRVVGRILGRGRTTIDTSNMQVLRRAIFVDASSILRPTIFLLFMPTYSCVAPAQEPDSGGRVARILTLVDMIPRWPLLGLMLSRRLSGTETLRLCETEVGVFS